MKKRIIALLLVIAVMVTVTACGGSAEGQSEAPAETTEAAQTVPQETDAAAPEQTAAPTETTLPAETTVPTEPIDEASEALYQQAVQLREEGNYPEAIALFQELGDYRDARQRLGDFLSAPSKMTGDFRYFGEKETCRVEIAYGSDGSLISLKKSNTNPTYSRSYIFTYDDRGNCVEYSYRDNDGDTDFRKLEYDGRGFLITETDRDSRAEHQYDELGNRVRSDLIYDGEIWYTSLYEYDENGNMVKELSVDPNGEIQTERNLGYDENGLLIQEIVFSEYDFNRCSSAFVYDEDGHLLKYTRTFGDGDVAIDEYTYDQDGNVIQQVNYLPDGSVYTSNYSGYNIYYRPGKNNDQIKFLTDWIDPM